MSEENCKYQVFLRDKRIEELIKTRLDKRLCPNVDLGKEITQILERLEFIKQMNARNFEDNRFTPVSGKNV